MTNLQRITGKTFGETASATGEDPEIGQFGSAKAGTYIGTTDVATIQGLPAWSNGFIDSVTPDTQFPPLPEVTGAMKVLSYQENYLLQKGIAEWDSGTTYYAGDFCKGIGEGRLYYSKIDNNINNALTDTNSWEEFAPVASTTYDGQWVYRASGASISEQNAQGFYDLSSTISIFLPNDNYKYEVLFSVVSGCSSNTVACAYFQYNSGPLDGMLIMQGKRGDSNNNGYFTNTFIYPINENRSLYLYIGGVNFRSLSIKAYAYRRIGTNV